MTMADSMADDPQSPLDDSQINLRSSPTTARRNDKLDLATTPGKQSEFIDWDDDGDANSSPLQADVTEMVDHQLPEAAGNDTEVEINAIFEDGGDSPEFKPSATATRIASFEDDKENMGASPFKSPSPRKVELSPFKPRSSSRAASVCSSPIPASSTRSVSRDVDAATMLPPPPSTKKSARFTSPRKSSYSVAAETPLPRSRAQSLKEPEDAEPQCGDVSLAQDADDTSAGIDETNIDDTAFSQFSVIPEMTLFSKIGESARKSPAKQQISEDDQATPRPSRKRPSLDRSPSPTPRRLKTPATDRTNNSFLIDFTQQIERFTTSTRDPRRSQASPSKSSAEPHLLSYLNSQRTPAKKVGRTSTPAKSNSLMNLLDFELPPAPTPRSIPTISVRELESMKSAYQSEISSLKATLTGREAEVESLKRAVADAEHRVGESIEAAKLEKSKREYAENEKDEWEKRGKEVENVLNSVKEEVIRSETEKEDLANQVEDNKRRAEEFEERILDLETQLASARAAVPNADGSAAGVDEDEVQRLVQARLDAKIEAVSRELHSVYKKKHETKVATLKKSYEARSEKKCAELQAKVEDLTRMNDELNAAKDDTFSGVLPHDGAESRKVMDEQMALINEQRAQVAGLTEELKEVKTQQARLSRELEQERVEKGELVAAVDEMLLLQSTDSAPAAMEDFRKSIQRPMDDFRKSIQRPAGGLRTPAPVSSGPAGGSRIGKGGSSGLARPSAGKSKMMSNIERMGGARND